MQRTSSGISWYSETSTTPSDDDFRRATFATGRILFSFITAPSIPTIKIKVFRRVLFCFCWHSYNTRSFWNVWLSLSVQPRSSCWFFKWKNEKSVESMGNMYIEIVVVREDDLTLKTLKLQNNTGRWLVAVAQLELIFRRLRLSCVYRQYT